MMTHFLPVWQYQQGNPYVYIRAPLNIGIHGVYLYQLKKTPPKDLVLIIKCKLKPTDMTTNRNTSELGPGVWGMKSETPESLVVHNKAQRTMAFPAQFNHADICECINNTLQEAKRVGQIKNCKDISDGYHTFDELYETRAVLNITLFKKVAWSIKVGEVDAQPKKMVWRSRLHHDGTMFDGMFIFGYDTTPGKQITFHYHLDKWDACDFAETLDKAPEWDGHTSADVLERLKRL